MTLAKMTIYVTSVDKMTVYEASVDKMIVDDTLVGTMSADIMTRDKMTCCQMLFTETFFSQCLKMRSLTKKQTFPTFLTKIKKKFHFTLSQQPSSVLFLFFWTKKNCFGIFWFGFSG